VNINPKIESALTDIGCPVDPIKHDGAEDKYIVYYTYSEVPEFFADDEPIIEGTYGTVTIYCKGNFKALAADVKSRLRQAGFTIRQAGPETYESDTGYYGWPIEIYINEGLEE
jgi:hypothetical protein